MTDILTKAADYYNGDIRGHIWPDNKQSKCAFCGKLTHWNIIPWSSPPTLEHVTCCSYKCLDSYKAEAALKIVSKSL